MNTIAPSVLNGSSLNLQVTGAGIGPDRIIRLLFAVQRRCCSYSVWLYGLYHGALQFLVSCFFSPFSIAISSLGEEGAGLCASRAFVCLFCTRYFLSFFSSS